MICLILNYNLSTNGWNRKIAAHLKNTVIFSDLLALQAPKWATWQDQDTLLALSWTVLLPVSSCSSTQSTLACWARKLVRCMSPKTEDALVSSQPEIPLWTRPSGQMQNRILFSYCPMQEVNEFSCLLESMPKFTFSCTRISSVY